MKKLLVLICMVSLCMVGFSQTKMKKSEFLINPHMLESYSQAQIDQMYAEDFAQLFTLNFYMTNYAVVAGKLPGDNHIEMQTIDKYAHTGVVTNEEEIIRTGFVNPNLYDFKQDPYRSTVYPLRTPGYYIIIPSKTYYDEVLRANLETFED